MNTRCFTTRRLARFLASACLACLPLFAAADEAGFSPIFDGQTLNGWETPDTSYWTVEEGAITGRISPEHPCAVNQYLVWRGGDLADFELKIRSRLSGQGGINNGFQFRSRVLPDHDVCGYQMDNNLATDWLVRLYDEYGRHTLAWRGERAAFGANGQRHLTRLPEASGPAWFKLEDWHDYHLICVGANITLHVDGRRAAEVEDLDVRRSERQGALALQLHSGPPTVVQFKDIRLKILMPAAKRVAPVATKRRSQRLALEREALAWWPLDTGGHGAQPRLRHIPDWEKFELNVRASGPNARVGSDVIVLDGAYFEAARNLHGNDQGVTVFLRARDPRGAWDASLLSKRGTQEQLHLHLFSTDLPHTAGPDIGFEIGTSHGIAQVSFPVTAVDATAWLDLVGRYDGERVEIWCNARRMESKRWSGSLIRNDEPLLIGAESQGVKIVRHFRGELQEAGLWNRVLTSAELRILSRNPKP